MTAETSAPSRQRSIDQERATAAWRRVAAVRDAKVSWAGEYAQLARGAPADIQTSGLGQTLAFWKAKGKVRGPMQAAAMQNAHQALLAHLSTWVSEQITAARGHDLLDWVIGRADTDGYRRATAEALAYLAWLRRFAEAELREGEESGERP